MCWLGETHSVREWIEACLRLLAGRSRGKGQKKGEIGRNERQSHGESERNISGRLKSIY